MHYFRLDLRDVGRAREEVRDRQSKAQGKLTRFHVSAEGMVSSVWTEEPNGEALFHLALDYLHIPYEVGDEQQVHAEGFGVGKENEL